MVRIDGDKRRLYIWQARQKKTEGIRGISVIP